MNHRDAYPAILAVLTRHDPEGLIRLGAPADEYAPEARDLTQRIISGQVITEAALVAVWTAWFGDTAHLLHDLSAPIRTAIVQDLAALA